MTAIRTVPVHEIVQRTFPRPPKDGDEVAMAIGRAIDGTLSEVGHWFRQGRRPTSSGLRTMSAARLDDELETAGQELDPSARERVLVEMQGVLQAYRASEIFGLARPKTRMILIGQEVGIYAQPDYWDGVRRFFEMKSYLAIPPPPDVALQLRLFQLAFPGLESVLICLDRHSRPVATRSLVVAPPTPEESAGALRLALKVAREHGEPKVLEYVEGPFVPYSLPSEEGKGWSGEPSG